MSLTPIDPSPADITGDCVTGLDDIVKLIDDWGMTVSPADYDDNNIVNVSDLLFALANWTW